MATLIERRWAELGGAPETKVTEGTVAEITILFGERIEKLDAKGFKVAHMASKKFESGTILVHMAKEPTASTRGLAIELRMSPKGTLATTPVPVPEMPAQPAPVPSIDGLMSRVCEHMVAANGDDNAAELDFCEGDHVEAAKVAMASRLLELKDQGFSLKPAPKNPLWFEGKHADGRKVTIYLTTHSPNVPDNRPVVSDLSSREMRIAVAASQGVDNGARKDAQRQGYIDRANAAAGRGGRRYATTDELNEEGRMNAEAFRREEAAIGVDRAHGDSKTVAASVELPTAAQKPLPDATYTVVRADGSYRTLRVVTIEEGQLAGKTIVKYLGGPDNESDYVGCAFLTKETRTLTMWKKFRGGDLEHDIRECVSVILGDPLAAGEAYALMSGKCCRCGRKLTVPASLHRGMGPECANKSGF